MRKPAVALFALAVSLLVASGPVTAHHSDAMFDDDPAKRVVLKGTVVRWVWANPHCLLQVDVTGDDGQTVRWVVETSNPLDLVNRGWSNRSLEPGDEVTVTAEPARSGRPLGHIIQVQLADGSIVGTTGTGRGAPARQ